MVSNTNKCNEGNVFIEGTPICGPGGDWTQEIGNVICQELGFRRASSVKSNGE